MHQIAPKMQHTETENKKYKEGAQPLPQTLPPLGDTSQPLVSCVNLSQHFLSGSAFLLRHCQILHCQPLQSGPLLSGLAIGYSKENLNKHTGYAPLPSYTLPSSLLLSSSVSSPSFPPLLPPPSAFPSLSSPSPPFPYPFPFPQK